MKDRIVSNILYVHIHILIVLVNCLYIRIDRNGISSIIKVKS